MTLDDAERNKLLKRSSDFEGMLRNYKKITRVLLDPWVITFGKEEDEFNKLRRDLQRAYGGLKSVIKAYGELPIVEVDGTQHDAFEFALSKAKPTEGTLIALEGAITTVNMTIGKLQSLPLSNAEAEDVIVIGSPKSFIAHSGEAPALSKLKDFINAIGVIPMIAEEQPSEDRSIGKQVDWCLDQCDCAIILATKGDIDGKTGEFLPRGNILIEIGKCQERFPGKIIYLIEQGTKFPTNISEKVRARFTPQSMDRAFTKVVKELVAFGIVKAVKP